MQELQRYIDEVIIRWSDCLQLEAQSLEINILFLTAIPLTFHVESFSYFLLHNLCLFIKLSII